MWVFRKKSNPKVEGTVSNKGKEAMENDPGIGPLYTFTPVSNPKKVKKPKVDPPEKSGKSDKEAKSE